MTNAASSPPLDCMNIKQLLQQAIAHHQAGQLQEAECLYRVVLQVQPGHADANHNLGVLAVQVKQAAAGLPHFKIALETDPDQVQFWLSYIDALIQCNQIEAASQVLQEGRQRGLQGDAVDALASRLTVSTLSPLMLNGMSPEAQEINELLSVFAAQRYHEAGLLAEAMTASFPQYGFGWKVLGAVLSETGRNEEALAAMQASAALSPQDAEAHYNLGNALLHLGRLDEAVLSYRRALAINPDFAEAYGNMGNALKEMGQVVDAVEGYRRALQIKPDYAEAHNNLGIALHALGQFDDAMASYRCALEISPDYAGAHYNLANALQYLGQFDKAVAGYHRALQINPGFAQAYSNLGNALRETGQFEMALASYRRALELKPDYVDAQTNLLFIHNYMPDRTVELLLTEARRFGELVAGQARSYTDWPNTPEADRCLRIGMVSGDFRNHPVGYFIEAILAALAPYAAGRLELFAYSNCFHADSVTARIKACCHSWCLVAGLSNESLARQVRDDGVDILIDLSGHTAHNRLSMFAWKPAPVQVSWLGYFATTGVSAIDYLIADPWTVPDSEKTHFTETVWHLPETRLCFTPPDEAPAVSALPALANGYITFGCFNNLSKMSDAVVALWSKVLHAVPGSRLFLKAKQLCESTVRQSVISRFATEGIGADRLILEGPSSRADYLCAYHRVDIALDPFPFPGGTTSVEGLWMGVPVLNLAGERFLPRQGIGLLMNAGLPEWIASNADDYVARAVLHAGDLERLATLRCGLRQQVLNSPVFDATRFARHFEAALRGMWQKWCNE